MNLNHGTIKWLSQFLAFEKELTFVTHDSNLQIMLIAGTETPYLTLEWAMALLLNNPHAMVMIKNEIHTHVGSDRLLQENDLDKLSYLQNVIKESLRLYPTLPLLLPREAS